MSYQGVPYAIVKGKARLGTVVHKKASQNITVLLPASYPHTNWTTSQTAAVLALTEVRTEDKSELSKLLSTIKEGYSEKNEDVKRHWGGGIMGAKAVAAKEKKRKALESAIKI